MFYDGWSYFFSQKRKKALRFDALIEKEIFV
jgi:hypothetical protein